MTLPAFPAAVAFLLGIASSLPAAAAEQLITIPTRPGVTQSFYLTDPDRPPTASLILFIGNQGKLSGYGPANLRHGNFLVRSRDLFVARGFTVAIIDAPSDESSGMGDGFRVGKAHRADIAATVAWLRQHKATPVWLVGTSMGTLSATNGATLEAGGPDGLVLTSSVTRESKRVHNSVYDAGPNFVKVPTLIVHNREDGCVVCPFSDVPDLLERFKNVPRKQLIAFQGGDPPMSEPCEALSRHGYLGIEDKVVAAITDWITAK
ncbi:MAG TPA: alpha/beta hydrolase [Stellaceae bacterium]|nr:alpha/beta hydrolase [Stellaceae bacterium]